MAYKHYLTQSISLFVSYSLTEGVPGTGGTAALASGTNLSSMILPAIDILFRRTVRRGFAIRRIALSCNEVYQDNGTMQLNMFEDVSAQIKGKALQEAILEIRSRFGKNSLLKGINFEPAATGRERNMQIGGHRSGNEISQSTHVPK